MSDIDQVLSQALNEIDAEDAGIDTSNNDKGANDDKATEDAGDSKPATGKDDAKSTDTSDDKPDKKTEEPSDKAAETDGSVDEEGQYTADDAIEVEDTPTPTINAPVDQSGIQLSPAEQKYVVDNIGEPIVLNGYRLDKDGNQEAYSVKAYAAGQLPPDFKFASDADALQATQAFTTLEQKANTLLQEKRQNDSRAQAADFERRENEAIRSDVAELQKEGRMPKFRVQPGSVGFDEDPAAQVMDEVLKIMADRNQKYLEAFNKGAAYRHIGFEQAYDIYERTSPARKAAKAVDDAQAKEDTARKSKAERGDSNRGEAPRNIMKATVAPGTTTRDLMAMIDAEEL